MPTTVFSKEAVAAVQKQLDNTTIAPNLRLKKILWVLISENIAHFEVIRPDALLIDPENRAKSMLDWYQSHAKVETIVISGGNEAALGYRPPEGADEGQMLQIKSVCFELPPLGKVYDFIIKENERLICSAGGHLAPITNKERHTTVASTHVSQGFKAVKHGCETPLVFSGTEGGKFNCHSITAKDETIDKLICTGWTWLVLPYAAKEQWPMLASFLESTYNVQNNSTHGKGEIESMLEAATRLAAGIVHEDVVTIIGGMRPSCSAYLDIVVRIASLFEVKDLRELHALGFRYGNSRTFGEEFLTSLYNSRFYGGADCNLVRFFALGANLVSSKVTDGIAKALVKTDLAMLCSSTKVKEVAAMTSAMETARKIVLQADKLGDHATELKDLCFILCSRLIFFNTNKKARIDEPCFETTQAIYNAFWVKVKSLGNKRHLSQIPEGWESTVVPEANIVSNDSERIIKKRLGVTIGCFVMLGVESEGDPALPFRITAIEREHVHLTRTVRHPSQTVSVLKVEVPAFVERFKKARDPPCPSKCRPTSLYLTAARTTVS